MALCRIQFILIKQLKHHIIFPYIVFPTVYGKSNLVMKIKLPNVYSLLKHHDTIWFNRGGLIKREEKHDNKNVTCIPKLIQKCKKEILFERTT